MTTRSSYALKRTLDTSYEEADRRIREALSEEGFGVLTEIDVRATLAEKLGEEVPPYEILGACNPTLAHRAITAEPDVGLLLPCNVVVRREEESGVTVVEALAPLAQLGLADNPALAALAEEVSRRLERALDRTAQGLPNGSEDH